LTFTLALSKGRGLTPLRAKLLNTMRKHINGLLLIAFCLLANPVIAEKNGGWPEKWLPFYETLTSPYDQWSPTEFGESSTQAEKDLLAKFKPEIYIAPGGQVPINFYQDYLPYCQVKSTNNREPLAAIDRAGLKRIERQYGSYLDFQGDYKQYTYAHKENLHPSLYGCVFYETLMPPKGSQATPIPIVILKYSSVFVASGLPTRLGLVRGLLAGLAGDPNNWHELDIHGAIHIILERKTLKPIAVLLAQHNHFRSFVVGKDFQWPQDQPLKISFAKRSNEPYLYPEKGDNRVHPTAGSPKHMRYILTGKNKPFVSAYDQIYATPDAKQINYNLTYLPSLDPLYTSWIPLGDRQKVALVISNFARVGPPGINMNTHPALSKYGDIAQVFYMDGKDPKALEIFEANFKGFEHVNVRPILDYNGRRFWEKVSDTHAWKVPE